MLLYHAILPGVENSADFSVLKTFKLGRLIETVGKYDTISKASWFKPTGALLIRLYGNEQSWDLFSSNPPISPRVDEERPLTYILCSHSTLYWTWFDAICSWGIVKISGISRISLSVIPATRRSHFLYLHPSPAGLGVKVKQRRVFCCDLTLELPR